MPAPTNTSFLTATDLGTLTTTTQTVTLQIDDAGVNYTTYYSFVAPTGAVVIGAFGRLGTPPPTLTITPFLGPASSPTQLTPTGAQIQANTRPIQFPVTVGSQYFIRCVPGAFVSSPTTLTLDVTMAPTLAVPAGSLAVNDDSNGGFPLALLSSTADFEALRYIAPFPFGEGGDTLENGTVLVENDETHSIELYNASYQLLETHVLADVRIRIRTCLGGNQFYVVTSENPNKLYTVTPDGTLSAPETLTAMTSCSAAAASNDETILYHSFTGTNAAIRQWTIGSGAAANFAAGVANYVVTDILVLGDDSIVVSYFKSTVTRDFFVRRFDAAGLTLNTYTFDTPQSQSSGRLAYAIDDPNSFWVMLDLAADTGIKHFYNIKASDGSILTTRQHAIFETGVYGGSVTMTPPATFGVSVSCPLWITRASVATTTTTPIRRLRRFLLPSSPDNHRMQIPTLELLLRTGIGLTPGPSGSPVQGQDPQVMMRISKDGCKTWGPERPRSAGRIGRYKDRVDWLRATGNYRNAVMEITVSDPVDWQLLAVLGEPVEGSS